MSRLVLVQVMEISILFKNYDKLGWLRPPLIFPGVSVYDGCMTILLSDGTIVAQSGVVYETCLQYEGQAPEYVQETFGLPGQVICCKGRACGNGAVYLDSWPPHTQVYDVYGGKGAMVKPDNEDNEQAMKQAVMSPPTCKKLKNGASIAQYTFLLIIVLLLVN